MLDLTQFDDFENYGSTQEYMDQAVILKQGDTTKEFHMILSGTVDIITEGDTAVKVAMLGPGEFFGEMSCITGERISATVIANGPVKTLKVPKDGLLKMIDLDKDFRQKLITSLIARVQLSNQRVEQERMAATEVIRTIHQEGEARYGEFQGTSHEINRLRSEINLLAKRRDSVVLLGEEGTGKMHAAARLHYEGSFPQAPLLTMNAEEFNWEAWEKKVKMAGLGTIVVRRADRLQKSDLLQMIGTRQDARVLFTMANAENAEHPLSSDVPTIRLPALRDHKEDIPLLIYAFMRNQGMTNPEQSITNEALRRLVSYPYISGNVEELKKIVEASIVLAEGEKIQLSHLKFGVYRVKGERPKIGLALGSGAVRGCAHIGILKVLERENIPIDFIAGTSVGAVIGALYAGGMSVSDLEKYLPGVSWNDLTRLTWPRGGFVHNKPMARWLRKYIGDKTFEDLRIPFACVAANAQTGEAVYFRSGSVADAVRASTAIPIMMKPVTIGQGELVDGGVVHRVPVSLARSMGADFVIAVDVDVPPFEKKASKGLVDTILNTIYIMSENMAADEMELADIVMKPRAPVNGYSFKNARAFFQKGEEEANAKMPELRQALSRMY